MFSRTFTVVQVLAIFDFTFTSGSGDLCGLAKADPDKTCISVRLPWQEDPIYFCQDTDKIKYRKSQCYSHGCEEQHKGQLLISTPWDCCPLVSQPDACANEQCGEKPFNRTCVDVPLKEDSTICCTDPFCEEGLKSRDECHQIALEKNCLEPPKHKTNCIGFVDPFGCCTKFQCAEDTKPGLCPKEKEAMKFAAKWNGTDDDTDETETSTARMYTSRDPYPSRDDPYARISRKRYSGSISYYPEARSPTRLGSSRERKLVRCVGDFNCPGKMKCCSLDVSVYNDGTVLTKNENHTPGYCFNPVKE